MISSFNNFNNPSCRIGEIMETFVDEYVKADGEKSSVIFNKISELGFKYHIGEHDFVYDWKKLLKYLMSLF